MCPVSFLNSRSRTSWIGTLMSTNHNMQTGRQTDEIFLIPYQITDFLLQEEQYAELAAQVSARQASSSLGGDRFLDNTLARAWHHDHPEDYDNVTRSSDEVGDQCLGCLVATVLKRRRTRTIYPRFQDRGVAHERSSHLPECRRRSPRHHHPKPHLRELRRPE